MNKTEILNATPEFVRHFATMQLDKHGWRYTGSGLFSDLLHNTQTDWFVPIDDYTHLNMILSPKSCLGRMALAGAFTEKYYTSDVYAGDVIDDFFREAVSKDLSANVRKNPLFLNDVILYEDPHTVLCVGDQQFEPLSKLFSDLIVHPKIQKYPLWDYVLCGMLCAVVNSTEDIVEKREILNKAKSSFVIETIEVLYMDAMVTSLEDNFEGVLRICEKIIERKKSARAKHTIYSLTGRFKDELEKEYTSEIFNFFRNNYEL